ncbi:MAG: hypothetical protein R6X14_10075 [bacterium]
MLWSIALTAAAATTASGYVSRPRSWHEFDRRVRGLTQAVMTEDTREMFRMFVPTFQQDISFARFDSAFRAWQAGRRAAIGQGRIAETRGISGRASTFIVFAGEDDYDYVFQNWVYAGETWQLAWLSNILDRSFTYGDQDSAAVRAMRAAALYWLVAENGLGEVPPGFARPDTVLVIDSLGRADWLPGHPTVVRTPTEFRSRAGLPAVPFAFRFALTRSLGQVGVCTVDLIALSRRPGATRQIRSIQVFLEPVGDDWRFLNVGGVW